MKTRPDQPLDVPRLRTRLVAWYRRTARDLPWRRCSHDPYRVWLSEIMLQQTQVATVVPYYEKFVTRFPTVFALASADRDEVLELWAGLGYYRRAHQLHDAAQRVAAAHAGIFPDSVDELLELPGIGRYTAGAIASIAFDVPAPVLDGNVRRVLARLTASRTAPDSPAELRRQWNLAEELVPRRGAGEFNQALMELGATTCTPRDPACRECPLASQCRANLAGCTAEIPPPRRRSRVEQLQLVCLLATTGESVLVMRRATGGLWGGAWGLPTAEAGRGEAAVVQELLPMAMRRAAAAPKQLGSCAHRLTHRLITFDVFALSVRRRKLASPYRWLARGEAHLLPTAFRKVLQLLP